jgi:hypothetical protein
MASQSVWGTVESQILMRRLTIVGANLLFLWAMSPLGGQASLRLLETSNSTAQSFTPLRYLSQGLGSTAWAMTMGTYVEFDGRLTQVESMYAAALLGNKQAKEGPEDTWGNVKIPYLDSPSLSPNSSDVWIEVAEGPHTPEHYFSLVGVPVIGRPQDREASFNLELSYFTVQCEPFRKVTVNTSDYAALQEHVPGQIWKNMSIENDPWSGGGRSSTFFLDTNLPLTNGNDYGDGRFNSYAGFVNTSMAGKQYAKRQITYASKFGLDAMNLANCSLGQIHVEAIVACSKDKCAATKVRHSLTDERDANTTPFDHILIAELALKAFPRTFGWSKGSNPTEQFLYNTTGFQLDSPLSTFAATPQWKDLALLDPALFAKRFALLLNTYYQLTLAPTAYLGNLPSGNLSTYGADTIPALDVDVYLTPDLSTKNTTFTNWYFPFQTKTFQSGLYFVGATTNATISTTHQVFVCNFAWLSLLLAAATTILITGIASLILKRKTLGPEMFGFVTSMTYGNPFVKVPRGGSMLDAMERARLLKDVEVCVGDVCGDEVIGHIALAAGVPLRKLERGRLYC